MPIVNAQWISGLQDATLWRYVGRWPTRSKVHKDTALAQPVSLLFHNVLLNISAPLSMEDTEYARNVGESSGAAGLAGGNIPGIPAQTGASLASFYSVQVSRKRVMHQSRIPRVCAWDQGSDALPDLYALMSFCSLIMNLCPGTPWYPVTNANGHVTANVLVLLWLHNVKVISFEKKKDIWYLLFEIQNFFWC